MSDLDVLHEGKPRPERDADIVSAAQILIAVIPYGEDDPRSFLSDTWKMIRMGRAAGRDIIYVPRTGRTQAPGSPKAATQQRTVIAVARAKDVKWATHRGQMDRKSGTGCRRYQQFRTTYNLSESKLTRQMWIAYAVMPTTRKKRKRARSVWTVSGGLPTLGKGAR